MLLNQNEDFSDRLSLDIKNLQENYSFYQKNARKIATYCSDSLNSEEIASKIEYLISTKQESFMIPLIKEDKCLLGEHQDFIPFYFDN
jgi:hypothetical protein